MQTPKTRTGSSEVPQKVSPRAVRQLRPAALDTNAASTFNHANKTLRSPKVTERRSPRSPVPERKRPSRISELESQNSQLKEDLKKVRDQLSLSESCKRQAQQDAEESKVKLFALSVKLQESQNQLLKLSATEEAHVTQEHDSAWQSKPEAVQKQLSDNPEALTSAVSEIQQLKVQLQLVTNCENAQAQLAESSDVELLNLKQNLEESLSLLDNMKNQVGDCKESAQAQALVNETLRQLEAAKRTVEFLRTDATKAVHGYNSTAVELDQSRARVNSLDALVNKLAAGLINNKCNHSGYLADNQNCGHEVERLEKGEGPNHIEEIYSLKSEVGLLRSALQSAENKYQEERIRSTVQIRNAYELMDQIKSESSQRESELQSELKRTNADIEELRANLMDKETELQGIVEENEKLNLKLERSMSMSSHREHELNRELKRLDECVVELKGDLMDKETTLQSISEENEMLKVEINKRFAQCGKVREEVAAQLEAAKAPGREAVMKLGIVMEEADRSNRKAARVAEQLEVAQAANSEIEAELRRLKVQSDQWRKAAEAAAAMLSAENNGRLTDRSLSLDNNYKPLMNKYSSYCEDIDDDIQRKKNGNMLKKIGVLLKKPQK